MQSQLKHKLTYFNFKGRAEAIRLILAIGNIQFEDQRITQEEFTKLKEKNQFKYGQLPVLEIDGNQYAQSSALVRYAAKISGLLPSDPIELLKAEQSYGNFTEILDKFLPTFYLKGQEQAEARQELVKTVFPKWLQAIEKDLTLNGSTGYTAGSKLSFADIYLFDYIEWYSSGTLDNIPVDIASSYPNIQKVFQNVKSHPQVIEWSSKN